MEDFDFNDTAPAPLSEQEFLMENLCVKKGRAAGGYEPPPTRSAAKRWKNVNEQNMMTRLNEMHIIKKQNAHKSKEAAREIIRKIPVELLAKEWLSKEDASVDMRAYLVDQILPTLILGVERLLREVDEKGLSATNRFEPEFNPINYLAQYLMRNNPRFSNFAEASPYVRGLRQVSEEIKQELFTFEDNRLARIKAETRRKRSDRERYEQEIREGKARRHNKLISQFSDWTKYSERNTVELAVLQNALSFFLETVELLPPELHEVAKFSRPLEPTDETGKTLSVTEFAQYISLFVDDLPQEIFHQFLVHMTQCAATYNASADRETRRIILTNLFLICDYGVLRFMIADRKLGLLDRARIMTLFENFWDMLMMDSHGESIGTLRNPRRWPVVEVEEVDDILFDAWFEEPDGGIMSFEADEQNKLLEAIRAQILEEGELNAAKDKAAKEKWKIEQLEQKSAGYRAKLYKYNVTDYMNLIQYPYLDTMEASIRNFDNTDGKLTMDHDLYASTLTKTARERNKDYKDDLLDFKKVIEEESKAIVDDYVSDSSYKSDLLSDASSERPRKHTHRHKNKNMSSTKQKSSSHEKEEISLGRINRNNNTLENNGTSSEDNKGRETNSRHDKMKIVLRQRQRDNRNVRVSSTSEESSEESDITPWPRLKFRRPSSFSSEDELRERQRVTSGLTARSLLLTPKSNIMSETQRTPAATGPRVLPPVQLHRNVEVEQHTGNVQKRAGGVSFGPSLVYYLSGKNDSSDETIDENEDTLAATEATAVADIVKESEATIIEAYRESNAIEEMAVRDEIDLAEANTTLLNESTTIEQEEITQGKMKQLEETSKEDEKANILEEYNQNNGQAEDKKEAIQYEVDSENENNIENVEVSETLKSFVESETMDGVFDIVPTHKVGFGDVKPIRKSPELAEKLEENIKNESDAEINNKKESDEENINSEPTFDKDIKNVSAVEEKADVAIMRELVASQNKMLASKTYTAGRAKATRVVEKPQSPATDHILELLKDDNKNRNDEDSNVNSCMRARVINTSSTTNAIPEFSAFQELLVNLSQFVQLFENFIGLYPDPKVFATLVNYVSDRYEDLEPDKTDKLLKARERETLAKKKAQLNALFEKWDNDASGFLELDDVTEYMCKFKDGQEIEAIRYAQFDLKKRCQFFDGRLSKREFRDFLNMTIDELPGKETFDLFVDFLMNSVERSYGERIRGEARKKWLHQINLAARTGGTSMEPVYKSVFQALYKDAETHGGEKRISASISMLETNRLEPSRGELMLRYSACTPEDCQYMLGKPLYKNMKGVSFQAVETGKPVHIPRVAKHGNIYFWNYDRNPEARSGSFIAIPLKDNKKRVFGVLGVDTMIDPRKDTIFTKHEIQFFQGVAKAFSIAYHYVEKKRKFLIVLERTISWFRCRCPHVLEIAVYFKEPNLKDINDYVLRKTMVMDNKGKTAHVTELIRLEKKDNYFRQYLFDSLETSSTVIAEIHDRNHAAFPIRDNNGMADGIVDLNTGKLRILPRHESRDTQRLLRLLQRAYSELIMISLGEDPQCVLEAERDPVTAVDIMFERLMLQEVRDNICRIDPQSYIEIKGFYEPPRVIAEVVRATVAVFKVDQVGEGEFDDWDDLKNCINVELITNIRAHDPIASARLADADKLQRYLKATFSVSFGEIAEQGSILAQQLYNWVFTCLALINYMMRESAEAGELVAAR